MLYFLYLAIIFQIVEKSLFGHNLAINTAKFETTLNNMFYIFKSNIFFIINALFSVPGSEISKSLGTFCRLGSCRDTRPVAVCV